MWIQSGAQYSNITLKLKAVETTFNILVPGVSPMAENFNDMTQKMKKKNQKKVRFFSLPENVSFFFLKGKSFKM